MNLILLFGASGDIHKRKVYPGLFELYMQDIIKKEFPLKKDIEKSNNTELLKQNIEHIDFEVIGMGRTRYTQEKYHNLIQNSIEDYFPKRNFTVLLKNMPKFKKLFSYMTISDYSDISSYLKIRQRISEKCIENIIVYCGLPDYVSMKVIENIKFSGISTQYSTKFLVEKPLGNNLDEYQKYIGRVKVLLDDNMENFKLIDHYLAKTSLVHLKPIKELKSYNQLKKIEIVLYETYLVDNRISYFDKVGLINDVFQSHMLSIFDKLINKEYYLINLPFNEKGERGQYSKYPGNNNIETYFKFPITWNDIPIIFKSGKKMSHNDKSIKFYLKDDSCIEYPILSNQNEYYVMFKSILENDKNQNQYFLTEKENEKFWCLTSLIKDSINKQKLFIY